MSCTKTHTMPLTYHSYFHFLAAFEIGGGSVGVLKSVLRAKSAVLIQSNAILLFIYVNNVLRNSHTVATLFFYFSGNYCYIVHFWSGSLKHYFPFLLLNLNSIYLSILWPTLKIVKNSFYSLNGYVLEITNLSLMLSFSSFLLQQIHYISSLSMHNGNGIVG